jgi:hypothetical protein
MIRPLPFIYAAALASTLATGGYSSVGRATGSYSATCEAIPDLPGRAAQGFNPRPLAAPMYRGGRTRGVRTGKLGDRRLRRLRNQAARAA